MPAKVHLGPTALLDDTMPLPERVVPLPVANWGANSIDNDGGVADASLFDIVCELAAPQDRTVQSLVEFAL
jgi:hypothetical protein